MVNTTPFHDMDGKMLGSVSIWTDLTEIRIQQEKIKLQNERIAHAAIQANEISHQLSSAAERLAAQINEANTGSGVQLERAGSTATAMEEMNATIFEVARNAGSAAKDASTAKDNAQNGADIVSKVIEAISAIHTKAEGLRISMEKLGTQAESIGDVMNVISDIADQTNLLALNAAIEAARAGDAGRGFAVVADEVRKLAEKTMRATLEVGEAISVMQNVAASNVHATGEAAQAVSSSTELAQTSGETLREIVTLIETVADQVSSIATAADQQSAASDEINRSMDEINRISEATAGLMTQSLEAVQGVSKMASELNRVIAEMSSE
jgi:methyl-accepting chemotaxis protein